MTRSPLRAAWTAATLALLAAGGPAGARAAGPPPRKPNVVFILADDLGWADLGCYGADLHETPHLDRLAREGVRFTQAYAMSVCSPSRAAILTGQHAARLHITTWRENAVLRDALAAKSRRPRLEPAAARDIPHGLPTIANLLHDAGYLTFHVGKWHVGGPEHYPELHGFDVNVGGTLWGAPNSFFWPFKGGKSFREPRYVPGLGAGKPGDYLTDRLTDEALKLIESAKGRPFFLNLWHHAPHTPIEAKPGLIRHYRAKLRPGLRHQNAEYAAMVHSLDESVGRVLAKLRELGIADRTLVVFTSDNGGFVNAYKGRPVTNNAPLRSGKGSLYEGGVRVPLLARLPGLTPAGAVCAEPVLCTDFFPTLAALAGAKDVPAGDGVSLLPLLRDPSAKLGREALYFHYPHYYATTSPVSAVRAGDWKLLEYFEGGRVELYNLKEDVGESRDRAAAEPGRARALRARLAAWRKAVGAQVPLPNPKAPPAKKGVREGSAKEL
jgi:arylsulfatase A-like enzyme